MDNKRMEKKNRRKAGVKQGRREPHRTLTQVCFTLLTNGHWQGFRDGSIYRGASKNLCVPGLSCYSCPGALGSCPIGALQAVLTDRNHSFSFYMTGFFMVVGAALGRLVCGWLCPFGLFQDLLHKIPFPKREGGLPGDRWLRFIKYGILIGFVILLPLVILDLVGQGSPWFCKLICPSGTLMAGIPLTLRNASLRGAVGGLFAWKIFILFFLLFLSVVVYRPFCRYLCPLGAIYGLCNPISLYRFRIEEKSCTACGTCQKKCKLDIPVWKKPNSPECIRCGDCKKACPHGAIGTEKLIRRPSGGGQGREAGQADAG